MANPHPQLPLDLYPSDDENVNDEEFNKPDTDNEIYDTIRLVHRPGSDSVALRYYNRKAGIYLNSFIHDDTPMNNLLLPWILAPIGAIVGADARVLTPRFFFTQLRPHIEHLLTEIGESSQYVRFAIPPSQQQISLDTTSVSIVLEFPQKQQQAQRKSTQHINYKIRIALLDNVILSEVVVFERRVYNSIEIIDHNLFNRILSLGVGEFGPPWQITFDSLDAAFPDEWNAHYPARDPLEWSISKLILRYSLGSGGTSTAKIEYLRREPQVIINNNNEGGFVYKETTEVPFFGNTPMIDYLPSEFLHPMLRALGMVDSKETATVVDVMEAIVPSMVDSLLVEIGRRNPVKFRPPIDILKVDTLILVFDFNTDLDQLSFSEYTMSILDTNVNRTYMFYFKDAYPLDVDPIASAFKAATSIVKYRNDASTPWRSFTSNPQYPDSWKP